VVEALLVLGRVEGVPLLERIIAEGDKPRPVKGYHEAAQLARVLLPLLQDGDGAQGVLASTLPAARLAAARALASKGDLRALPVLIEAALQAPADTDAARRWRRGGDDSRHGYEALRDAAVRLGRAAMPELRRQSETASDWRRRLFCEAVALRISDPGLVERFEKALRARHGGFMSRAGPSLGTFRGAGERLAAAVGRDAIPLLEEALAFAGTSGAPSTMAFALAVFKEERSIPPLLEAAPRVWAVRGGHPLVVALQEFGAKGVEAAAAVAPPDPAAAGLAGRAARHRVTAGALVLAEDARGADQVLAGLLAPIPEPAAGAAYQEWRQRTAAYLELARKLDDGRLLPPLVALARRGDGSLACAALEALLRHEDERLVPLAWELLGNCARAAADPALELLLRQLQGAAAAFLVERLDAAREDDRVKAIGALARLGPASRHWRVTHEGFEEGVAAAAVAPLARRLEDPSAEVQGAAALALVALTRVPGKPPRDAAPVKPLCAWVRGGAAPPPGVITYLVESGDPEVGPALLAAHRAAESAGRPDLHVINALGKLAYGEALADLVRTADEAMRDPARRSSAHVALRALARLGAGGVEAVHESFRRAGSLWLRIAASRLLAEAGHARAADDIAALLDDLLVERFWHHGLDEEDPNLSRETRYVGYVSGLAADLAAIAPERAYDRIAAAFLVNPDPRLLRGLTRVMERLKEQHPALKGRPVPAATGELRVPILDLDAVPVLRACELWRRGAENPDGFRREDALRAALLAGGDVTLDVMVELCFAPLAPPSRDEVARAVDGLADPRRRDGALLFLATRVYSARLLAELAGETGGEARRAALAVERWREHGPWFIERRSDLLRVADALVTTHWPIERLRAFTVPRLERLAKIERVEHAWGERPQAALLASLRYSPDPAVRALLPRFAERAPQPMADLARRVAKDGLAWYGNDEEHDHWRKLPPD
jgi:hypothetical protein